MNASDYPPITTILAVGSVVVPIIFGFMLWKMSTVFVTKEAFKDYRDAADLQRQEMRDSLKDINANVNRLLDRHQ